MLARGKTNTLPVYANLCFTWCERRLMLFREFRHRAKPFIVTVTDPIREANMGSFVNLAMARKPCLCVKQGSLKHQECFRRAARSAIAEGYAFEGVKVCNVRP